MEPRASIIITTHNRPMYLPRALASALKQTEPRIEVIVVDDASEPQAAVESADPRVVTLRNPTPLGACGARNTGLAAARAPFVTFLDDDDWLEPTAIADGLNSLVESRLAPPVAALGAVRVVAESGAEVEVRRPVTLERGSHYMLEPSMGRSFVTHSTLLAPARVLREIGGFDERIRTYEHDDLFLRLNQAASLQGRDLVSYNIQAHSGQRNSQDVLNTAIACEHTLRKHRDMFNVHPRARARYMVATGTYFLRAGSRGKALRYIVPGALRSPSLRSLSRLVAALAGPRATRRMSNLFRSRPD